MILNIRLDQLLALEGKVNYITTNKFGKLISSVQQS
jgi:hypothetical protein